VGREERVRPGVLALLEAWEGSPAFVTGAISDVLAANALAVALSPLHAVGGNLLRSIFLQPGARALHPDGTPSRPARRDGARRGRAGPRGSRVRRSHRRAVGRQRRVPDAVGEASRPRRSDGTKRFAHPRLGEVELRYETFAINGPAPRARS
jgi:hypothetical protein